MLTILNSTKSPVNQAIFRISSAVCSFFRQALLSKGFIEIHSTKFQESGTESGAAVFKVDYFRRPAFLAQSPQLAKQMAIAADMERVFEIGPVFRAENSNTHRHLTEFTGLDLEMTIENHYHEVVDLIDEVILTIFKGLQSEHQAEVCKTLIMGRLNIHFIFFRLKQSGSSSLMKNSCSSIRLSVSLSKKESNC